jgi:hypothetical protein
MGVSTWRTYITLGISPKAGTCPHQGGSQWPCVPMFPGGSAYLSLATPSRNPPHTIGFAATVRSSPWMHALLGEWGRSWEDFKMSFKMSWAELARKQQSNYFQNRNEPLKRGHVNYLELFTTYWALSMWKRELAGFAHRQHGGIVLLGINVV